MKRITVTYRTDTEPQTTVRDGHILEDDKVKGLIFEGDTLVASDGYHTFEELYEHRYVLFIALCRQLSNATVKEIQPVVWRSQKHHDGTMFENMFIMGIGETAGKQITYHLPIRMWDAARFAETLDYAPLWDGHTPNDVIKRMIRL